MSIMHLEVVISAFDSAYSQLRAEILHVNIQTCKYKPVRYLPT